MRVKITVLGSTYDVLLMCDSGNLLREPVSALPVIILSPGVFGFDVYSPSPPVPVRAVTFSTAGGTDCFMAFEPKEITYLKKGRKKTVRAYVAVNKNTMSYGMCEGLFPASLY